MSYFSSNDGCLPRRSFTLERFASLMEDLIKVELITLSESVVSWSIIDKENDFLSTKYSFKNAVVP